MPEIYFVPKTGFRDFTQGFLGSLENFKKLDLEQQRTDLAKQQAEARQQADEADRAIAERQVGVAEKNVSLRDRELSVREGELARLEGLQQLRKEAVDTVLNLGQKAVDNGIADPAWWASQQLQLRAGLTDPGKVEKAVREKASEAADQMTDESDRNDMAEEIKAALQPEPNDDVIRRALKKDARKRLNQYLVDPFMQATIPADEFKADILRYLDPVNYPGVNTGAKDSLKPKGPGILDALGGGLLSTPQGQIIQALMQALSKNGSTPVEPPPPEVGDEIQQLIDNLSSQVEEKSKKKEE